MPRVSRTRPRVDDSPLAQKIGQRIRKARLAAGLTQTQLAEPRYTKAYISALENGLSRPSMAALNHLAGRLGIQASQLINEEPAAWARLEADLLLACGRWDEAIAAYRNLLENPQTPLLRAELLRGLAEALVRKGEIGEAIAFASESVELFRAGRRESDAAVAEYWLSAANFQRENVAEAKAILHSLLARVRAGLSAEPDFRARILMALSTNESREGNHAAALAYLEEVKGLAADLDDRRRATYLYDLAYSYRETGDFEAAVRTGIASLELFRRAEAERETGALENDLSMSYLALGNSSRAAEMAASARARFERLDDRWWLAFVLDTQARIALARGNANEAALAAEEALGVAGLTGNVKASVDGLLTLARARTALGDEAGGLAANEQAAELARTTNSPSLLRKALRDLADALAASGDHERAFALMREAITAT
ncbi:MAG: helix-turn-helix transcriptional regulator [Candidatus Limnocylindrales bacterium]|jgi:transcriptional regulator with XRE-family HTH domain